MKLCRGLIAALLFFLTQASCFAGELLLAPQEVINGGVAVLHWVGASPDFAVVRFADKVIYLYPDRDGAVALLPVPLDMPPGNYPLLAAVADKQGETTAVELELQVRYMERPQESLTLPVEMVSPRDPEVLSRIERESRLLNQLFSGQSERLWDTFVRPVDEPISSVFGKRRLLNGQPRAPHGGTDFRSPAGTHVRAMSSGRVVLCRDLFYAGKTVVLDHGEGLFSLYAHLSSYTVRESQSLSVGDVVGKVGNTGRSTGPHLHLTVRLLGERIDPIDFLETLSWKQDS
ncbi:MAG: M23 family metallopeptidase [Desulfuromonadales bacterium]|nr:M23 family metallopeptidase [Desulfuromonadales bacterium]